MQGLIKGVVLISQKDLKMYWQVIVNTDVSLFSCYYI